MATVGSYMGAKSQKSSLNFQAGIADINAKVSEMNARELVRAGIVEESRVKLAGAQSKGEQINRMASSGIDIAGSPTALARLTTTDVITEVDAQTMRTNALRAAWGQRFEAGDQRRKAMALRTSAASISPFMSGLSTLLTSAGQVAASWYSLDKNGAFGSGKTGGAGGIATSFGNGPGDIGSASSLVANANDVYVWPSATNGFKSSFPKVNY
jgi:hypothetical protein